MITLKELEEDMTTNILTRLFKYASILLIISSILSCDGEKLEEMNMPEKMPPLLEVERGLDAVLENETVLFEKYIQTRMGNAEANRLYANGDLYKVFLGSNQSIKNEGIAWNKVGTITEKGIQELEKLVKKYLLDYVETGSQKRVAKATENINWYFYFDKTYFAQSQSRPWKRDPKFVRKINRAIEGNFKPAFLSE